jgi:hypothetical protein
MPIKHLVEKVWENHADFHGEILSAIKSFPHIALRGAGEAGQQMLDYLLAEGVPKEKFCFWDKAADQIRQFSGVPVLSPFPPPRQDTLVLHCILSTLRYNAEDYEKHGWTQHMDGCALLCPYFAGPSKHIMICRPNPHCALNQCPRQIKRGFRYVPYERNMGAHTENFLTDQLSFMVNTRCTLKCRHCCQYINHFLPEKRIDFPSARILSDIDLACSAHDFIRSALLLGGEPFLHPDLPRIIKRLLAQPNVGMVVITSNGICRISEENLEILQDRRVHLRISSYLGMLNKNQETLLLNNLKKLEKNGVAHTLYQNLWSLPSTLIKQNCSPGILRDAKSNCACFIKCCTVANGTYYPCTFACAIDLHGIANYTEDKVSLEERPLRDHILAVNERPYYQSCAHCDFSGKQVPPGEQGVDARYAHIGGQAPITIRK